ncbi:MAG: hypothetical protein Q7R41_13285, partial [Phycisphaerales bacterium]|nr:hypothetical protein [Phycisphaerales bacterium]
KNTMRVIFQRSGSNRRFSSRGRVVSTKSMTVTVPNVSPDMPTLLPAVFRIRLISKFGLAKSWTNPSRSPEIFITGSGGASGSDDCDLDGAPNSADTDDDNDLLPDATEAAIGTDPCLLDTDGDGPSDYYEYRVAFEFNGGPTLPYPGRKPYPDPLFGDSDVDFDGDKLTMAEEYAAWQFTGRMDRFYSDASQDSDADGIFDEEEDEDADLLPNWDEIHLFNGTRALEFTVTDTDGDGLCDGLDDIDHDGPPTSNSVADCSTTAPNNGPSDIPPGIGAGDPDPARIDLDDNIYSNWYELQQTAGSWYDPCDPSLYPISPFCPYDYVG